MTSISALRNKKSNLGFQRKSQLRQSKILQLKSKGVMPPGVTEDIFVRAAKGSHIWDIDGNQYIDYILGYGPVILGHSNSQVQAKVHEYDSKGVIYGRDTAMEIDVARKIRSLVSSAEMVRFFVTGTEATMNAIKIARAHTGKEKIVKFEGHYHGFHDYVSFSTEPSSKSRKGKPQPDFTGIPRALQKLIIVLEWNDFEAIEKTAKRSAKDIAAVITEPVMANSSVIPPSEGYLKFLKETCDKHGILLIFDEVKTGFRLAKGGAQGLFGVQPHLTAIAKSLGNGYPISAVVGLGEIMEEYGTREILPNGTYARNPVSLAAADATLDVISREDVHRKIEQTGGALIKGLQEILHDKKIEAKVQGFPSMFQVLFTNQDQVANYREFKRCDEKAFERFQDRMLKNGVMIDDASSEPMYTSAAHNRSDVEQTLAAFESSLSSRS